MEEIVRQVLALRQAVGEPRQSALNSIANYFTKERTIGAFVEAWVQTTEASDDWIAIDLLSRTGYLLSDFVWRSEIKWAGNWRVERNRLRNTGPEETRERRYRLFVRALGACHCGRGHELILRCFANADEPSIRVEAVRVLGTLRTRYARTMLDNVAREHPDPVTRENAVGSLHEFGERFDVTS